MLQTCILEVPVSIQSPDTSSVFAGVSQMHTQMPRYCLQTRNDHNKQQNNIMDILGGKNMNFSVLGRLLSIAIYCTYKGIWKGNVRSGAFDIWYIIKNTNHSQWHTVHVSHNVSGILSVLIIMKFLSNPFSIGICNRRE
jgi:hypothetical protein